MRKQILAGAALTVALGLTGAGPLGTAVAGEASPTDKSGPVADNASRPVTATIEKGVVLEGSGSAHGVDVLITVYDNSRYGSSVQVVLGDPDDERIGYAEQATAYVVDGILRATVEIDGVPVTVAGSVTPIGTPTKIQETIQDGGAQIVTRGTHRTLATDVQVTVGETAIPIAFDPAFAFDLQVRTVDLYGPRR